MRFLIVLSLLLVTIPGCAPKEESKVENTSTPVKAPLATDPSGPATTGTGASGDTNRTVDQAASNIDTEAVGVWRGRRVGMPEDTVIELKADGTFTAVEMGTKAHGTFVMNGNMIELQMLELNGEKPKDPKGSLRLSDDKQTLSIMSAGGHVNVELKKD